MTTVVIELSGVVFLYFDLVVFSFLSIYLCCKSQSIQILEYHPQMLGEYLQGADQSSFMYPRYCYYWFTTTINVDDDGCVRACLYVSESVVKIRKPIVDVMWW
jgi:hypothetical protein